MDVPFFPVVEDKEFAVILQRAPTLVGLERLVRHCLMRLAEERGFYESLSDSPREDTA